MAKEENLGVFVKKHASGMVETDKGHKFFKGNLGDTLIRNGRECIVVPKSATVKESKEEKAARIAAEKEAAAEAARIEEQEEAARIAAESAANEGGE